MSSANGVPPNTSKAEGLGPALVSGAAPLVVGILLTADRAEMTARAIRSFEAQTYERKCLLVLDSGTEGPDLRTSIRLIYSRIAPEPKTTVGHLRNIACQLAKSADIIAHWDSDDWSHPRRLEEQVALLQASGADCVGYNEILFWESRNIEGYSLDHAKGVALRHDIADGAAWIYENDALDISQKFNAGYEDSYPPVGASYCYWRAAWERLPFPDIDKGEDTQWKRKGARCYGVSGLGCPECACGRNNILPYCPSCGLKYDPSRPWPVHEPRLICEIHGRNTSSRIAREFSEFRRAPQWDSYCKEKMEAVNVNA